MKIVASFIALLSLLFSATSHAGTTKWDAIYGRDAQVSPGAAGVVASWKKPKTHFIAHVELELTAAQVTTLKNCLNAPSSATMGDLGDLLINWTDPGHLDGTVSGSKLAGADKMKIFFQALGGVGDWTFKFHRVKTATGTTYDVLDLRRKFEIDKKVILNEMDSVFLSRNAVDPTDKNDALVVLKANYEPAISANEWEILKVVFGLP
jgi:hypothetical protein